MSGRGDRYLIPFNPENPGNPVLYWMIAVRLWWPADSESARIGILHFSNTERDYRDFQD
jgi:hypothetical protein